MTASGPASQTWAIEGSHLLCCGFCLSPWSQSCPRDTALRQKCGSETIWMVYVTEPS